MAAGDSALNLAINITAIDAASSVVNGIANTLKSLPGPLGGIATAAVAAGAAIVGIGVSAAKAAGDFQSGMTTLVTGAGEAQSNLKMVSDGMLQMSVDTATSTKQLTDGMYMIESAGFHGADGLNVLKAAAEGAKVGNADLGTVANALTTILTDYHMSTSQANSAMSALVTTVADGKTHMADLSTAMGNVLPLASALGISFPQVAGAIAVMTNSGMDARRASMDLANAIRSLAAPNAAAQKSMQAVGISAQELKDTLTTKGLSGAIQLIEEHVGKTFPAGSVQAVEAFKAIMGGATGYNVALMVGGKNMASYEADIKNITAAMKNGGDSVQGWDLVQEDFNFKVEQAQQALNVMMITLGQELLPVFGKVVDWVTQAIVSFTKWESQTHMVENALNVVVTAIGWLIDGLGKLGSIVSQVWSFIAPTFDGLAQSAEGWGKNFMVGFENGIVSVINDIISTVEQVAQEIANYLGFASPTKKGPGTKLHQWGQGMVAGLVQGIKSGMPMVTAVVSQVAGQMAGVAQPGGGLPGASTSTMIANNGDTRKVTVTPEAKAATTATPSALKLTQSLSSGVQSGTSTVKTAVNAVGKHLQSLCSTHAQATSSCAAHHLTTGLASKIHANAHHVAAAAHAVGIHMKHVATHAATHATAAAHHLTHGLASKTQANTPAVAGAVSNLANDVAKGLQPVKQAANNAANGLKPINQAANSVASAVTTVLNPAFKGLQNIAQGIAQWFKGSVVPALKEAEPGFQQLGKGVQSLLTALIHVGGIMTTTYIGIFRAMAPVFGAAIPVVIKLAGAIADVLGRAIQFLAPYFVEAERAIGAFAVEIAQRIAPIIIAWIEKFESDFENFRRAWMVIWPSLAPILKGVWDEFVGIVKIAWSLLSGIIKIGLDLLGGNWKQAWEDFKTMLVGVWDGIKTFLQGVWEVISGVALAAWRLIQAGWNAAANYFKGIGASISAAFQQAWTAVQRIWQPVGAWFAGIGHAIVSGVQAGWNGIVQGAKAAWSGIVSGAQSAWNGLISFIQGMMMGVANLFVWLYQHNYYFQWLVDTIVKIFTAFFAWIKSAWNTSVTWLTNLWNGIKTKASEAWKAVTSAISAAVTTVVGWLQNAWTASITWLTNLWNTLETLASDAWQKVGQVFSGLWSTYISTPLSKLWNSISGWWTTSSTNSSNDAKKLWSNVQTVFNSIWTTYISTPLTKLWNSISTWFSQLAANCLTWAGNAMKQFAQGITNGVQGVLTAVSNLGSGIAKFLGFHSPPADGPLASSGQWMPNMMTMFATGVTSNSNKLTTAVQGAAQGVNQQFTLLNQQVGNNVVQTNAKVNTLGSNFQTVGNNVRSQMTLLNSQITSNTTTINANLARVGTQANQAGSQVKQAANTIGQNVTAASTTVSNANQQIGQSSQQAAQTVNKAQSQIQQSAKTTTTVVKQSAQDAQRAWDAWMQHGNQADDAFAKAFNELFKGQLPQAMKDFQKAFEETGQTLLAEAQTLAAKISGLLGHSKPTTGPLKDDDMWGKHFVENLVGGMKAGEPLLTAATNQIASKLAIAYPSATSNNAYALSSSSTSSTPQSFNLQVNLDGKQLMKYVGVQIAKEIRVQGNVRGR